MPIVSAASLPLESWRRIMALGPPKEGKAQPLDTLTLTPTGWRNMGDLKVGDLVIGSLGKPVAVTGVFPQGMKQIMRVTADDGASTLCCEEHLWYTTTVQELKNERRRSGIDGRGSVKTTKQIAEYLEDAVASKSSYEYQYLPELQAPVQYSVEPTLLLKPYYLGLLLGDGSFRKGTVTFSKNDEEVLRAIETFAVGMGDKTLRRVDVNRCTSIAISRGEREHHMSSFTLAALSRYGLRGLRSEDKFIPRDYLTAPIEDRLEILRGLCDTDGHATDHAAVNRYGSTQCEYSTSSPRLRNDVIELVRSLGGRAYARSKETPSLPAWSVMISFPDGTNPFRLERKASKWNADRERIWRKRLVSVEEAGSAECVCIAVDAEDSLYITSDFLLTHNTTMCVITAPRPTLVVSCNPGGQALDAARRRTEDFDVLEVKGFNSMNRGLSEARDEVNKGAYKSIVVDDHPYYVDRVQYECLGDVPPEDYGKSQYQFKKRIMNQLLGLFELKCHIIFANHYIERGKGADGKEKQGEGILPLYPGSLAREVAGLFNDIVFLKRTEKSGPWQEEPYNGRVIVSAEGGAWTSGVGTRSTDKAILIPADITQLINLFSAKPKQQASSKKPNKK